MNEKYHVIDWNSGESVRSFDDLNKAKKYCKALGHEPKNDAYTAYAPVAFVGAWMDDLMTYGVVYNPRFAFEKITL